MKRKRDRIHSENLLTEEETRTSVTGQPLSLTRSVSPPPTSRCKPHHAKQSNTTQATTAQVEAGEKDIEDHFVFFSHKILSTIRPTSPSTCRLEYDSLLDLYSRNASNPNGHHFVIHQHDHPVAGTHYDLRLQCNATSSVSWAIMYGLPGDPNSRRLNRNATETRIHCLWNHLVETASHQTGTLLIWDTGVYEVLPYRDDAAQHLEMTTDEETSGVENRLSVHSAWRSLSEPEKLHRSFQERRIRLRLHGTRLPAGYTLSLWLRSENDRKRQPTAPKTRRTKGPQTQSSTTPHRPRNSQVEYQTDTERDSNTDNTDDDLTSINPTKPRQVLSLHRHESPPASGLKAQTSSTAVLKTPTRSSTQQILTQDREQEQIRQTNAYIGAINSINSIHQRRWYLSLDRVNSGFVKTGSGSGGRWVMRSDSPVIGKERKNNTVSEDSAQQCQGFLPFHVLGRDHERSVVTERLAGDILDDEGVVGYVPRGKWRPVTE